MQSDPGTGAWPHWEPVYAIKTWRYLRLAMVAIVFGLGVSIAFERSKVTPGCFQTSISAYYYTPVHGIFVGALVGIGVCLMCLRGSTDTEDVLLNLAGMFAPVVAFVPTPEPGSCASVLGTTHDRNVNIANNVTALLAVAALALLVFAILAARNRPTGVALIGYAAAVAAWLVAALVFWLARDFFVRTAHYTAATLMFICIVAVVASNAVGFKRKTQARSIRNRYAIIGGAMVASVVVIGIAGLSGWQ